MTNLLLLAPLPLLGVLATLPAAVQSFSFSQSIGTKTQPQCPSTRKTGTQLSLYEDDEEFSDFAEFGGNDNELDKSLSKVLQSRSSQDLSACRSRQLSLGRDFVLVDFVGNMGFDEVTDWQYYYQNEEDESDRKVVEPNPFDKATPKRTRSSSGSVIRLFRGELVGPLGGMLSAQGYDRRVLIKEFFGDMALELAKNELSSIATLQSNLLTKEESAKNGDWYRAASSRSVIERQDNNNVMRLLTLLRDSPFVGIIGEVNLSELDDMDPNEFYRALSVSPPKPDAVWIVYEYPGLSSISAYASPAIVKQSKLPVKKGFFGNPIDPPSLPSFQDRANYVVKGIFQQALEAMATLHDCGIAHRSIGRSSIILSSPKMDKREASNVYTTTLSLLTVKMADFGFSGLLEEAADDEEFRTRARTYGYSFAKGERSIAVTNFAIAEDMHALGFVAIGLLLTSLAEPKSAYSPMPATDEDTLQRLLGDIFDDVDQFREYMEAEEIWTPLVELLDKDDRAGWKVLDTLFNARERAAKFKDSELMLTSRGLLNSPFFN